MADDNKTGTGAADSTAQKTGSEGTGDAATKTGDTGASGTTTEQKTGDGEAGKTTPDPKTEAEKPKADGSKEPGDKAGAQKEQPKAPEKYELQVPDAVKNYVDASYLAQVEKTARAGGLSNDEAQAFLEDSITHVTLQANTWADETKADKTYGGDKLAETQQLAKRAIERVFPTGHERRAAFDGFLARGGAGNNINVVAFLAEVGRLMGEDSPAHGRAGTATPGDAGQQKASKLYDHPDSKAADGRV